MTFQTFLESLTRDAPPLETGPLLHALWHARKGDWARAHEIAQDIDSPDAAWVHAYLHRCEGDQSNAAYWYRQAARPVEQADLDVEWDRIVKSLLTRN